jgi:hypothetical protein
MSDLYGKFERSREAAWAHKEDVKAIEALRDRMSAEKEMAEKLAKLRPQSCAY